MTDEVRIRRQLAIEKNEERQKLLRSELRNRVTTLREVIDAIEGDYLKVSGRSLLLDYEKKYPTEAEIAKLVRDLKKAERARKSL